MSSEPTQNILFLHPFFEALDAHGGPREDISKRLGIRIEELDNQSTNLPANDVYSFLSWATEQIADKSLCASLGKRMAMGGWAPILPLLNKQQTLWQFFCHFSEMAEDQGGAAAYRIEVEGRVALWKLQRPTSASTDAVYADATAIGFFVEIMKAATGKHYDARNLLAITSSKQLIPGDVLPSLSVIDGAKGMTLRFPASWLESNLKAITPLPGLPSMDLPAVGLVDLSERARRVFRRNISNPEYSVCDAASALGLPAWKLQSELRNSGTNLSEIRQEIRKTLAIERVGSANEPISKIAASLGYQSNSNFSRAFRKWTGSSPSKYRKG